MEINGINTNKNMPLQNYAEHYDKDFNHSKYLKEVFGKFNYVGADYINKHGIRIEFKECLTDKYPINKVRFAVYYKDYLDSDYIVFCYYFDKKPHIYVHKTKKILKKYKFNKTPTCQPYLSTVKRNYLRKFRNKPTIYENLLELKSYLDDLRGV